ncbi:MAG: transporter [Caulobacter sp.]|nr:transporter [Caulobacter sp.]
MPELGVIAPMKVVKDRPYYVLALLVLVYMSNYVDRVVVGVLGEAIKTDLKISDTDLGLLTGITFVIFYGVLGVPIGRLADRFNRKWVLASCLTLWSLMTAVSGVAANFTQLMIARMGVGVGEAGCTPTAHSLLSDLFPPRKRSMAFGVYAVGPPLGIIAGTFGGGWIGQELGWRAGMFAVGLPGLILALVFVLTTREPVRGQHDVVAAEVKPPPFFTALKVFMGDRLFVHVMFGMACAAVGLYSISTFTVPFLIRAYDLKLFAAASLFGLSYGISGVLGASVGGTITDWLGTRDTRWYAGVPAIGYMGGGLLLAGALFQPDYRMFILMFVLGSVLVNIALAPCLAVVLNRVSARMRASASAVMLLASTLVGLGIGPTLTGVFSDLYAGRTFTGGGSFLAQCPGGHAAKTADAALQAACKTSSFHGLQVALAVMVGFYVLASLIYVLALRHTAPRTVELGAAPLDPLAAG